MTRIVIVDDEDKIGKLLRGQLNDAGYSAVAMTDPRRALEYIVGNKPDVVVTDLRMDHMDGVTLLKQVREVSPDTDVVIMTAYASVETALETMKLGAYDYIIKPFTTDELLLLISRIEEKRDLRTENEGLRQYLAGAPGQDIIGDSQSIARIRKLVEDLAGSEAPILIRGESGTGKELVARAIHRTSRRRDGPFIAINCAAIPESLLESELFGYERGAFTGAAKRKLGHLQLANGGSLFLDEIGDLPRSLQSKMLRVLEQRRVTPLGSEREVTVDFRLISATNRPLEADIRDGTFREDLYYRLNVFPIELPPLRDRPEDVAGIAKYFLSSAGRAPDDLSDEALHVLVRYHWPGNVRELRNVLERAAIVRPKGRIGADDIIIGATASERDTEAPADSLNIEDMERRLIRKALRITSGNKSEAARLLGITRRSLYGRLERYEFTDGNDEGGAR